jgi:sulfite exporter TauE/SafE
LTSEIQILIYSAITIACLHTLAGPDHYLPFIALSKARGWSFGRTLMWTIICGCGHVWSSVLLGLGGAAIGWSFAKLHWFEGVRGGIAGWVLLLFGLVYGTWGLFRAFNNKTHKHFDTYEDGMYVYEHKHGETVNTKERYKVTPWVMFLIFLLGPCEPMIPLLYYPAASGSIFWMFMLVGVYTFFTLLTMVAMVIMGYYGVSFLQTAKLEKYMHALGGFTIFICGVGILFMGW